MPADADLDVVADAFRVWEQAELVTYDPLFKSYQFFPSEAELQAGLPYPHTIHLPVDGDYVITSVSQVGNLEETDTDQMWTVVVLGKDENDLNEMTTLAARWKRYYRRGFLRHRHLFGLLAPPNNGGLVAELVMGKWRYGAFNFLGYGGVGLVIPITVPTRLTYVTGD